MSNQQSTDTLSKDAKAGIIASVLSGIGRVIAALIISN